MATDKYREALLSHGWDVFAYVQSLAFDTERDLRAHLLDVWKSIACDQWLAEKQTRATIPEASLLYSRAVKIMTSANAERTIAAMAARLWLEFFEPENIRRNRDIITREDPDPTIYEAARARVADVYGWTPAELSYVEFFVAQCLARQADPLLTRSLYFFSADKMTGKTTTARIISGIINGATSWEQCLALPLSDIPTELQFERFARPLATRYYCVVMDEAFTGISTAKYYARLKAIMTTPTASIEIKFGDTITVPAHRNYIYTSNNDISAVVSDITERRFNTIFFKKPRFLDYSDLFAIWRDYIYNCPRDINTPARYIDTMQEVVGARRVNIDDIKSSLDSAEFTQHLNAYRSGVERTAGFDAPKYQVSFPRFFISYLRDLGYNISRDDIKQAVIEVFGEPRNCGNYKKYYNISDLLLVLSGQSARENEDFNENFEKLPF